MGDFKKNPKKPFEVRVPNKIRKRIAMHERREVGFFGDLKTRPVRILPPTVAVAPKRGTMWSRFISRVAKMLQIKPTGVRK